MAYDDVTMRKREAVVTEHMVGELESFQLDQFSEGEIYLKEIRFGSMQSKNDILGLQQAQSEVDAFGGTLLCKIQLLREEGEMLQEVSNSCSQKVIAMQEYIRFVSMQLSMEEQRSYSYRRASPTNEQTTYVTQDSRGSM